ncbi:class I SAM-dependent methyltransferase [Roseobacteraceae bacterium S113]
MAVIDKETIAVYDARAQDYADLVDTGAPDARLRELMDRAAPGSRLLDLGCGPGNSAGHMAKAGFDVLAWDASSEMVARAGAREGVTAEQRVFEDLTTLESASFGGVWANFSLLHAPRADVPGHMAEIARIIAPGGVFLMAVKTGQREERDSIGRLYSYFEEDELRAWLGDLGFEVVRADHGNEPGLSGELADWVSLMAVKA